MILAGDIGGTNSRIAVFREEAGRLALAQEKVYPSREHKGLGEIISGFLTEYQPQITHAAFGIAGPVFNGRVSTPNLPWSVDAAELSRLAGVHCVGWVN